MDKPKNVWPGIPLSEESCFIAAGTPETTKIFLLKLMVQKNDEEWGIKMYLVVGTAEKYNITGYWVIVAEN